MKTIITAIAHLLMPCAIISMQIPPVNPQEIPVKQKCQEILKQPKTLFALAGATVLKQMTSHREYKEKLLALIPDLQEKMVENIPDTFQELLESALACHPELTCKMLPILTQPFSLSPNGDYACIRIPKTTDSMREFEIIDFSTQQRTHCPKEFVKNINLIDAPNVSVHPVFQRAFSWLTELRGLVEWCARKKIYKIFINKTRTAVLLVIDPITTGQITIGQKIFYYDVPTRSITLEIRNVSFHQTNAECNTVLFTDVTTQGRVIVARMPENEPLFTFTREQGLHPCFNQAGNGIAMHKERTISLWNMQGNITKQIEFPHPIQDISCNQTGFITVKYKLPNHSVQYAVVKPETGQYHVITDQELHDTRAIEVSEDHSLAYYKTIHGQEKLWSFPLNKPIRMYYPKIIKEKLRKQDDDSTKNYCLVPTHQIFKKRPLKELIALVLGK